MLTPAWYLPDTDWFAQLPDAPSLDDDGRAVIGELAQILNDEGCFDPAVTVAATHVLLLAVERLSDTMTYGTARHDVTELARLLCGLTLAQAHLTQTLQRIAGHINAGAFPGCAEAPAEAVRAVTDSLSTAGANSELLAGHLKEAHLILRRLTP